MIERASSLVREKHSWDRTAEQFEQALEKVRKSSDVFPLPEEPFPGIFVVTPV